MASKVPEFRLVSGEARPIPALGMGTAIHPLVPETTKAAIAMALQLGYRHFDTASLYGSEPVLGEAIEVAIKYGVIKSRDELFVTSKVWCTQCHPDLVIPSLQASLRNLQMEYIDLYLVHWPMSVKPAQPHFPIKREDIMPMDLKGVWEAMEECHGLGLAKAIGVSNFTTKKLQELLSIAKISPAVNQVEMNPVWQQKKLREFCAEKGIHITAYSPLGGQTRVSNSNPVLDSEVLKEIAIAKRKTVAQVSLRWINELGASMVTRSLKKERLEENLEIFDWELSDEDHLKISQIPQQKKVSVERILSPEGSSSVDLSQVDVVEM